MKAEDYSYYKHRQTDPIRSQFRIPCFSQLQFNITLMCFLASLKVSSSTLSNRILTLLVLSLLIIYKIESFCGFWNYITTHNLIKDYELLASVIKKWQIYFTQAFQLHTISWNINPREQIWSTWESVEYRFLLSLAEARPLWQGAVTYGKKAGLNHSRGCNGRGWHGTAARTGGPPPGPPKWGAGPTTTVTLPE
jgi:hypothetical protein